MLGNYVNFLLLFADSQPCYHHVACHISKTAFKTISGLLSHFQYFKEKIVGFVGRGEVDKY
jgi:hypothetical protein